MNITTFGVVWILISFLLMFFQVKHLAGWLVFSCIFQSAAVFNIDEKSILPLLITQLIFIVKTIIYLLQLPELTYSQSLKRGFYFVIYGLTASLLLPVFFDHKVKVYAGAGGVDGNFYSGGIYLVLSNSNYIQIIYLLLNLATLFIFFNLRRKIPFDYLFKWFLFCILFVLIIGFWEYSAKMFGVIPFPKEFFVTNTASLIDQTIFAGLMRLNSTFLEASYAGAFLAAAFWGVMSLKNNKAYLLAGLILLALVFNLSGTGIITFLLGGMLFLILNKAKNILILSAVTLVLLTGLAYSGFGSVIFQALDKSDSQSGEVRLGAALFTMELFLKTYGLGVGLGSHRGSSFIISLLASAGAIGLILFTRFFISLIFKMKQYLSEDLRVSSMLFFALTLTIGQSLAIPDLSFTPMWMWMFVIISYNPVEPNEDEIPENYNYADPGLACV